MSVSLPKHWRVIEPTFLEGKGDHSFLGVYTYGYVGTILVGHKLPPLPSSHPALVSTPNNAKIFRFSESKKDTKIVRK